jgi:uncharacterized protein YidB (DUF937 family)
MGLFDSVAGAVLGKVMGDKGGMAQMALDLVNQHGGLGGVLAQFKEKGLGDLAASWVSKGANLPISADQISSVLGEGKLAEMAAKLGVSPADISSKLAEHLPGMVDKLTPDGEVPADGGNILSQIMGMLK